jgi:AraC-like DNA-binding protein
MDVLADLLARARARGALFARTTLRAPWGLAFEDGEPLALHAVTRGEAWLEPGGGGPPVRLLQGDLALVRAPSAHRLASAPGAACLPLAEALARFQVAGRRYVAPGAGAETELVCGAYGFTGDLCTGLLAALPPVVHVPAGPGEDDAPLRAALALLADEVARSAPGQQTVLDRLLDLLLVYALRAHFRRPDASPPRWYRALDDPEVGRALRLLHGDPARAWTVAALAAEVGLSRAALARRFRALVGQPPLAYLTAWRLALVEERLRDGELTLAAIAREVGYASEFALSAAFKRERGRAPAEVRREARAAADALSRATTTAA